MKILILSLTFLFFFLAWAQEDYREPFESILPREIEDIDIDRTHIDDVDREAAIPELPDDFAVQGVYWGIQRPQAIINGRVYSVGDKIQEIDATIIRITDNVVFISYRGRVFAKTPEVPKSREGK